MIRSLRRLISSLFVSSVLASCATAQEDVLIGVGPNLPEFQLDVKNGSPGERFTSTDHYGKVFVVEFYFNACPACNQNHKNFQRLMDEVGARDGLVYLEVGVDCDDSDYRSWISKHAPKAKVLKDCGKAVARPMQVSRYPTFVIVDKDRKEQMRVVGVWSSDTYRQIKEVLEMELE